MCLTRCAKATSNLRVAHIIRLRDDIFLIVEKCISGTYGFKKLIIARFRILLRIKKIESSD